MSVFCSRYYNKMCEPEGGIMAYYQLKQRSHLSGEGGDTVRDLRQGYAYQRAGRCY